MAMMQTDASPNAHAQSENTISATELVPFDAAVAEADSASVSDDAAVIDDAPMPDGASAEQASSSPSKFTQRVNMAMVVKFLGLLAFFAVMALICKLIWPTISGIFEEGGVELFIEKTTSSGPLGVVILLGLQFLQIIVAFIPGEVVQVAAGMMYGTILGAVIIIVGCVISSAFVYWIVHKLGAPFVQAMVPTKFLEWLKRFEKSGKLNVVVFVLFLIPGLPKDTFTYLVPLTTMEFKTFLILSNSARIPGVLLSTYAANNLIEGNIAKSILLFLIAAVLAVVGLFLGKKYLDYRQAKEDPEGARAAKLEAARKKATRKAKVAARKEKRLNKKAKKAAAAYDVYLQAQTRMREREPELAQARVRYHEQQLAQAAQQNNAVKSGGAQQGAQHMDAAQQVDATQ